MLRGVPGAQNPHPSLDIPDTQQMPQRQRRALGAPRASSAAHRDPEASAVILGKALGAETSVLGLVPPSLQERRAPTRRRPLFCLQNVHGRPVGLIRSSCENLCGSYTPSFLISHLTLSLCLATPSTLPCFLLTPLAGPGLGSSLALTVGSFGQALQPLGASHCSSVRWDY